MLASAKSVGTRLTSQEPTPSSNFNRDVFEGLDSVSVSHWAELVVKPWGMIRYNTVTHEFHNSRGRPLAGVQLAEAERPGHCHLRGWKNFFNARTGASNLGSSGSTDVAGTVGRNGDG